jgi:hypothetical protein
MSTANFQYGDGGSSTTQSAESELQRLKSVSFLEEALVIDSICDPSLREAPPEYLRKDQIDLFTLAPRNSLICKLMTDGDAQTEDSSIVCFPFFSSHFSLPAKPGERVWVINPKSNSTNKEGSKFYWVTRISDNLAVEDTNFAAFARDISLTHTGPIRPESRELPLNDSGTSVLDLDALIASANEAPLVVMEPVPRITKHPGDFVLQGSNNTAISLGTDSGWGFEKRPSSSRELPKEGSAAIDIVSGRGRYFKSLTELLSADRKVNNSSGLPNSTQPFLVKNGIGKIEVDKNPAVTQDLDQSTAIEGAGAMATPGNARTNPAEGDPDFLVDASRVYVSEKSDIDSKLGLNKIMHRGFTEKIRTVGSVACVAVKSDHVRIVARKHPITATEQKMPEGFVSTNGTIRIVKEGNPEDDLAVITIEADGTIQISGKSIFLGRHSDDGGAGDGDGPGKSQPYIKYKQLEELWTSTMEELSAFCDTLLKHTTPGYGAPSPQINQAAISLKAVIESKLKPNIASVKSERIFGE